MTSTAHTKCRRCHRTLRSAESIARGYGRTCFAKKRAAAQLVLATYTREQVTKACELLADGAIAATTRHTFEVVSSKGTARYEVDTTHASCTCPAGAHGRACYHLAAATLAAA